MTGFDIPEVLLDALVAIDGVEVSESVFNDGPALWVNGREIAHWDDDGVVDVRLTRALIRQRRERLRSEPRVRLRRSTRSDWIEVSVGADRDDETLLAELIREAALVHRAPAGQTPPPAPDRREPVPPPAVPLTVCHGTGHPSSRKPGTVPGPAEVTGQG